VFSPQGYVETCSILSWIQLNRELLTISGDPKYAEEIERAAYNDLLGACAPNGEDWCYYSFPNGKRVYTTYWRCCKSSGAMALEELPAIAYSMTGTQDLVVNLYGPGLAELPTRAAGMVSLEQVTNYPFEGDIRIVVTPQTDASFAIKLRIPLWAHQATILVNGVDCLQAAMPGTYAVLERNWKHGDVIDLQLPMSPAIHWQAARSVQESTGPGGTPIRQEVMHYDYLAITRGPLVFATSLIDDFKMEETIRLPDADGDDLLEMIDPSPVSGDPAFEGPAIRLNLGYRSPLIFRPYYEAGGRENGAWRLTWMQVTAESAARLQEKQPG
jgi:DUF1680 family protein